MLKKISLLLILLCIMVLPVSCGRNGSQKQSGSTAGSSVTEEPAEFAEISSEGKSIIVEIPAPSLVNNKVGEPDKRNIAVYLPKSYEKGDARYPVVYYLTGWSEQNERYAIEIQNVMNGLVNEGKVKEMIFVVICGRNKLCGSFYVNSPVTGNWEDFVVKDVVGYIDSSYRTINEAGGRGISGHSMGGFGCLNIAMHYPDVFSCVYSMSPGIFNEDGVKGASNFMLSLAKTDEYENMTKEEAHKEYMQKILSFNTDQYFIYGYSSAFAPNPDGKAPYFRSVTGETANDAEIIRLLDNGFGKWDEKVKKYKDNLLKLKSITFEYGKSDEYSWIPAGCEYLSELLKNRGIKHELLSFEGTHTSKVSSRIEEFLLPFFSEQLKFD